MMVVLATWTTHQKICAFIFMVKSSLPLYTPITIYRELSVTPSTACESIL